MSVFQMTPAVRVLDSSGFSGLAPRNTATGLVGDRRPDWNSCRVTVSRPWDVLVELSWPGVGARKPVEYEARTARPVVTSKRLATLKFTVSPNSEKSS